MQINKKRTQQILDKTKVFLLDLDGTTYIDGVPIGDMINTFKKLRDLGKKLVFFTNNSSKTCDEYVNRLSWFGIYDDRDRVYTSAMATENFLKNNYPNKRVYLLGTDALKDQFVKDGINLVEENPEVAVMAYDTSLTFEKIKKFNEFLVKGAVYVSTHPDNVCPTADVFMPDVGSFIEMFFLSSRRKPDYIIGKPYGFCGDILTKEYGLKKDEFTMVGDRLYTDIKFGINCGFNSILVLSGETKLSDLRNSDVKPSLILNDFNEII